MSCAAGPNSVASGLVFEYDMTNTQKSWKGMPTTNLLVNSANFSDSNWSRNAGGLTITSGYADPAGEYTAYKLTETATTDYHRRGQLISGSVGIARRFSFYAKAAERTLARGWSWSGGDTSEQIFDLSTGICAGSQSPLMVSLSAGWYFCSFTVPSGNGDTVVIGPSNGVGGTSTYLGDATKGIYVWKPQLEAGTFASPWVDGTRSNTQAILDLTNNNTVTAASLTYASDGTFSFNGSSNYFRIPFNSSLFTFNSEQTVIIWMKNQSPSTARRNPYAQAYAGGGTITHEGDTNFNYYYGTQGTDGSIYTAHTSPFSVVVGETAMICITRNTSQTVWYKNGVLGSTRANPYGSTVVTGTNPIDIGAGYAGYFGGSIYNVQIYNRALSAAEVTQNFNAMRGRYSI